MYAVEQREPGQEFKRAWQAAGRHLEKENGAYLSWLRDTLNPPIAEHLSFLMGNQLFFVFIEFSEFKYMECKYIFSLFF